MVKNPSATARDTGDLDSIPRLGRSPKEGNGNPLQYSYLGNSMEKGSWWAAIHGAAESGTTEQLSASITLTHTHTHTKHTHIQAPLMSLALILVRGGNDTPLQYSYLENPMGGGAW